LLADFIILGSGIVHGLIMTMDLTDHWLIMSTQSEYQDVNPVKRVQFSQSDEKLTLSG
jgi:hypothetical protein